MVATVEYNFTNLQLVSGTVNSLPVMFARDLFDDFHEHLYIVKINTCKHKFMYLDN